MKTTKPKRTQIIAEAGVNHNGSIDIALELVKIAKKIGVDTIKFQTFTAESLVTKKAEKADYQKQQTGGNESQYDMLKKLELSRENHILLINACNDLGIEFLSTPFDLDSLDFLCDDLKLNTIKIGSGDLTNAPLLYAAAQKGVKLIVSTGMADLFDIEEAMGVITLGYSNSPPEFPTPDDFRKAWADPGLRTKTLNNVSLLQCTSNYPADPANSNLNAMVLLGQIFGTQFGFSDHTQGNAVSLAATALGATIIEKHITLDNSMPGPDHQASSEPKEFASLIEDIRKVDSALGDGIKTPNATEYGTAQIARKSLIALTDIKAGETFTQENLGIKRPGTGCRPIQWWDMLGNVAIRDYTEEDLI